MGQIVNIQEFTYIYWDFSSGKKIPYEYKKFVDLGKQENSTQEYSYECSLVIDGVLIDVYLDDYGQCYSLVYKEPNGVQKDWCCGTYNFEYMDDAIAIAHHINEMRSKIDNNEKK